MRESIQSEASMIKLVEVFLLSLSLFVHKVRALPLLPTKHAPDVADMLPVRDRGETGCEMWAGEKETGTNEN